MQMILVTVGVLVAIVAGVVVWLVWRTFAGDRRSYGALAARVEPLVKRLIAGEPLDPADLERFAQDRETRKVLYDALERRGKLDLFPASFLTAEAMAEADLVVWLCHPNELGALPDEIELMATLPAPGAASESQRYFVFRYKMNPPHWAAGDGWLAGVAGPYPVDGPVAPHGTGTFSRFEPYDSKPPEAHLQATHRP